ncbi:MAG: glycosyltransferase family 1 protein [Chitinophagaceae bacterium]|nr:glycosyltransferase family 1 protein [Chitinophagaceae bacterium]
MIKNIESTSCKFLQNTDLICFSHLRWDFVFQRPHHLFSRFSKHTRVFFIEEPIFHDEQETMKITKERKNLYVIVPYLKKGLSQIETIRIQQEMIDELILRKEISSYICWYYTPMALPFTDHLTPELIVYDCMDELSAFKFAPPQLQLLEKRLLQKADVVFTGGYSIYEVKKNTHKNIFPFPSSIDKEHFATARTIKKDPADQLNIPHPRFGFFGVLDERLDINLIAKVAKAKPEWQFVMVGPVIKIDPDSLPKFSNIHYLGGKKYEELPRYLAGWDVALIPFAMNESTKFISPTKTPEYLAAGKPVISAPIRDVISPYAENGLVHIAANAKEFIRHGETILKKKTSRKWLSEVDAFLTGNSWDRTWSQMVKHIEDAYVASTIISQAKLTQKVYV